MYILLGNTQEVKIVAIDYEKKSKFCDDNDVVLYSTGCPKCKVLEAKLKNHKIFYRLITDKNEMIKNGFKNVPVLKVNDKFFDFYNASNLVNSWANNCEDKNDAYKS